MQPEIGLRGKTMNKMSKNIILLFSFVIALACNIEAAEQLVPDATFLYTQKEDRVGYWLNTAGDMNGDGLDDFVIGSCHADRNGYESGAAFLLLGRANSDWGNNYYLRNSDGIFVGDQNDYTGYAIGGGGDVNGDGYDDLIIGSGGRVDSDPNHKGAVFIVFGKASPSWVGNSRLRDMADVIITGENAVDLVGIGSEIVGDINDDGYDDILLGAPGNDDGASEGGKAYLFLGRRNWNRYYGANSANATFINRSANYNAGYCVDALGDVNGDQIPDFIIGAPGGTGKAFVIFGRSNTNWGKGFDLANADVVFNGERGGDGAGSCVAGAGDVNGDGLNDILISAPGNDDGAQGAGKVYLKFGQRGNWDNSIYIRDVDASFLGEAYNDYLGLTQGASGGGDFNGDGFDDILMGAQTNDEAAERRGKAYVVYGKASGWKRNIDLNTADLVFTGAEQDTVTGMAINFVGDLNHDGLQDISISAPLYSGIQEWAGRVYLFFSENVTSRVSGKVTYSDTDIPLSNVNIEAACPSNHSVKTASDGDYEILLPTGNACTLTPRVSDNSNLRATVISSYDAALTAQYSVGTTTLSAASRDLADVNEDGQVDIIDAILICRFAAGMPDLQSSSVGDWRFTPESLNLPTLVSNLTDQNFTGQVLGNVDLTWPGGFVLSKANRPINLRASTSGNQIVCAIPFAAEADLISADIEVAFEPSVLSFVEVRETPILEDFVVFSDSRDNGIVRIGLFSTESTPEKGDILELVFDRISESKADVSFNSYRFNQGVDYSSAMQSTAVRAQKTENKPGNFRLLQNYPNPFNGETAIEFEILEPVSKFDLSIVNARGHKVKVLKSGSLEAGRHRVIWNGLDGSGAEVASGLYLLQMRAAGQRHVTKLIKMD